MTSRLQSLQILHNYATNWHRKNDETALLRKTLLEKSCKIDVFNAHFKKKVIIIDSCQIVNYFA